MLISPRSASLQAFSGVMKEHLRDSLTRDPTAPTPGFRLFTSSTGPVNLLTNPMRLVHERLSGNHLLVLRGQPLHSRTTMMVFIFEVTLAYP